MCEQDLYSADEIILKIREFIESEVTHSQNEYQEEKDNAERICDRRGLELMAGRLYQLERIGTFINKIDFENRHGKK